jgi:hypothetical protein
VFTFLGLQAGVGFGAALLIWLVVTAAGDVAVMREYFGSYEPLDVRRSLADLLAIRSRD